MGGEANVYLGSAASNSTGMEAEGSRQRTFVNPQIRSVEKYVYLAS